jgi:hypothetical protein
MLTVEWYDDHRKASAPADPNYPDGVDIDGSAGKRSCWTNLPYPAPRIGYFIVSCDRCGWRGLITTAGRPDDPRSIRVPCKRPVKEKRHGRR